MFSEEVPIAFSIIFLIAFLFPILMVARLADKGGIQNGSKWVFLFYSIYLTIVAIASHNDFYDEIMLPPKIVLTTTIPLAVFVTFIYLTPLCKKANATIELKDLVSIHLFRLIGSTFIILLLLKLIPKPFALFAGIGDLVTAISSIFVSRAVQNKRRFARRLTYIWNTFGLLDIIGTSVLAIVFTKISIDNNVQGVEFLAQFPFCFIPAFAPPTIIFLHLLVYRKLSLQKNL
ncbi:MAG: hypothetical protein MRY83_01535 [Flavobacteriales bacterium]|nr:hypothetical protein [Flavobacteriales bacterium]